MSLIKRYKESWYDTSQKYTCNANHLVLIDIHVGKRILQEIRNTVSILQIR